jgi:hypothetical protein
MAFFRPNLLPQERYKDHVPRQMLEAYPPRFGSILGMNIEYGSYREEGPKRHDAERFAMGGHVYD